MPKYHLRIDLTETLPEAAGCLPDSLPAVEELMQFLVNEFDNMDLKATLRIVGEGDD